MSDSLNWVLQTIRLTIFPKEGYTNEINTLWPDHKDLSLEKHTINPKTGENILEGKFSEMDLVNLVASPLRIEVGFLPPDTPVIMPDFKIPILGDYNDAIDKYKDIYLEWLKKVSFDQSRLALGMHILAKVSSTKEGYDLLPKFLPFSLQYPNYKDFAIQLNKQISSETIEDIKINQLVKINILRVNAGIKSSNDPNQKFDYPEQYYFHMELDINTDPESEPTISSDKLVAFYTELFDKSKFIIENGIK